MIDTKSQLGTQHGTISMNHADDRVKPISSQQVAFLAEIILKFNLEKEVTLSSNGRGYSALIHKKGITGNNTLDKGKFSFVAQLDATTSIEIFDSHILVTF